MWLSKQLNNNQTITKLYNASNGVLCKLRNFDHSKINI